MKYQVPQFIDVEDKIVGPLSIKQFLYILGTGGGIYLSFALLPIYFAIFPAAIIGTLGVSLAFVRINNRPFIDLLEAAFKYIMTPRLYVWRRTKTKESPEIEIHAMNQTKRIESHAPMTRATGNSLAALEWQIDTHDKLEIEQGQIGNPQA